MSTGRNNHACVFDETTKKVIIAGGVNTEGEYLNSIEIYTTESQTWSIGTL